MQDGINGSYFHIRKENEEASVSELKEKINELLDIILTREHSINRLGEKFSVRDMHWIFFTGKYRIFICIYTTITIISSCDYSYCKAVEIPYCTCM